MRTREFKAQWVGRVKDWLGRAQVVVLVDYRGLTVAEIGELRHRLEDAGAELRIVKNSVATLACRDLGLEGLEPFLKGPNALALGFNDPVAPARVLAQFALEMKKPELKAGVLEGRVMGSDQVKTLSRLPSRHVLVACVAGGLAAPLNRLAWTLGAPLGGLVRVIEARRVQLEASAPPA